MAFNHGAAVNLFLGALVVLSMNGIAVEAQSWAATQWTDADITFYGGEDASGTMGGSCGYGNLYSTGYGTSTAALSVALFNNGLSCGACFQIVCIQSLSPTCYSGASITVTATNLCPEGSYGGWCNSPNLHFDLSYEMFTTLAPATSGVADVQYRRVTCSKSGGIAFQINGNPYFLLVLILNVGGGGDVAAVLIKGDNSSWFSMTQNWGQNWQLSGQSQLASQGLSFEPTLGSGESQIFPDVAYSGWSFGQTYAAPYNF